VLFGVEKSRDQGGEMLTYAYFRVVGDEETIQEIHRRTIVAGARVRKLKAKRGGDFWWNWSIERVFIDGDNPDEDLKEMLRKHRQIFPIIKSYMGNDVSIYLEVVMKYAPDDKPVGLFLSVETISLLSELGAALSNDIEPQMTDVVG
jgi:hypothetical protein